jgi:hypothetical protein
MKKQRGHWIRFYAGDGGLVGINWLKPGSYYEIRCYRCDERAQILLPCSIDFCLGAMKGFEKRHKLCRQTLLGARVSLCDALRLRKWRLEHPEKR